MTAEQFSPKGIADSWKRMEPRLKTVKIIILSSINRARIGSREMAPVERADRTRTGTVLVEVVDIPR